MRTPTVTRALWLTVAVLFATGLVTAYRLSVRTAPVTLSGAVARFRTKASHPGSAASVGRQGALTGTVGDPLPGGSIASLGSSRSPSPGVAAAAGVGKTGAVGPAKTPPPQGGPAESGGALAGPHPGVYNYATQGGEHVSALGGQSHTYPARTTMTVTATPCGLNVRWDALDQRYDEWQLCLAGHGLQLKSLMTYHEFVRRADRKAYQCTTETLIRPESTIAGTTFGGHCAAAGAAAVMSGSVIGVEQIGVGSSSVPTVHVHLVHQLTGATNGSRSDDLWFSLADNLLVRLVSSTDADTQTSVGPTRYHEAVQLALIDQHPAT